MPRRDVMLVVFLVLYLASGLYTMARLVERKPAAEALLEDFNIYALGVADARQGRDPYAVHDNGAFLYPPMSLLFIEPLSAIPLLLPRFAAVAGLNVILLTTMLVGVARLYRQPLRRVWFWFPLAFGFAPFLELVYLGQINLLTSFGVFVMYYAETQWPVIAGFGLALAIVTKVTPLAYALYLTTLRRYRTLAATLVALLALVAVSWLRYGSTAFLAYPTVFGDLLRVFPASLHSQGLVTRLAAFSTPELQSSLSVLPSGMAGIVEALSICIAAHMESAQRVLTVYTLSILVVSAALTWRTPRREPLFIVTGLAIALAPNFMWYHHYVFLMLPLFVWMAWRDLDLRLVAWCCLGLLIVQVDRWHLTHGLLVHLFGQTSILVLVAGQWVARNHTLRAWRETAYEPIGD